MGFNMQRPQISEKLKHQSRYNSARASILLVSILSLINVVLLAVNQDIYFPFSASFPYFMISGARFLCGMYPNEFYAEYAELTGTEIITDFFPPAVFYVVLVLGVVLIAVFSLCFLLSKKKVGWMIAALVLFVLDTLYLISTGITVDIIIDILFHAWVLYSLIAGVVASAKLKSIKDEEPAAVSVNNAPASENFTEQTEVQAAEETTEEAAEVAEEASEENTEDSSEDSEQ